MRSRASAWIIAAWTLAVAAQDADLDADNHIDASNMHHDAYDDAGYADAYADDAGGYGGGGYDGEYEPTPEPEAPPPELITSRAQFDSFIDDDDASVVGCFGADDAPAFKDYEEMASKLAAEWRWAYVLDTELALELKLKLDSLYLFRSPRWLSSKYGDRARERFPGSRLNDEAAVPTWLLKKTQPLVGELTPTHAQRYRALSLPVLVAFVNIDWEADPKGTGYFANRARKVAQSHSKSLSVALGSLATYEGELADFGLPAMDASGKDRRVRAGVIVTEGSIEKRFGCEPGTNFYEALAECARSFLANELEPSSKRELKERDEPVGGDDSAVVTLTPKNFDEVVGDETKHKLVEFYAPWCGHCKALEPEYNMAALELAKSNPDVVLTKFDADAHEVPKGFDVQGFPTIFFVPKGAGSVRPESFEGERDATSIVEWIKERTGN